MQREVLEGRRYLSNAGEMPERDVSQYSLFVMSADFLRPQ